MVETAGRSRPGTVLSVTQRPLSPDPAAPGPRRITWSHDQHQHTLRLISLHIRPRLRLTLSFNVTSNEEPARRCLARGVLTPDGVVMQDLTFAGLPAQCGADRIVAEALSPQRIAEHLAVPHPGPYPFIQSPELGLPDLLAAALTQPAGTARTLALAMMREGFPGTAEELTAAVHAALRAD